MGSRGKDQHSDPRAKCSPVSKCWKFGLHNPSCQVRTWHYKRAVLKLSTKVAPSAQHVTGHHCESPTDMRADVAKILPWLQFTNKSTGSGRLPNFSNFLSWMCSPRLEKCHSFPPLFPLFICCHHNHQHILSLLLARKQGWKKEKQEHPHQHQVNSFEHSAQVGGTQHPAPGCCTALT